VEDSAAAVVVSPIIISQEFSVPTHTRENLTWKKFLVSEVEHVMMT
jgi:hypothetical protein